MQTVRDTKQILSLEFSGILDVLITVLAADQAKKLIAIFMYQMCPMNIFAASAERKEWGERCGQLLT